MSIERLKMKITRAWAMPNKDTFSIKPINELVLRLTDSVCIDYIELF
jgi:hypothetical protein